MMYVFLLLVNDHAIGVFETKQKAFCAIIGERKNLEISQTVRTEDGEEEFTPNENDFYLNNCIYVREKAHTEELLGIKVDIPERRDNYEVRQFLLR